MDNTESITPKDSNGKSIHIFAEICSSWGFSSKRKIIGNIANVLAEQHGYEVKFTTIPVKGKLGIYNIYLYLNNEYKMIYSKFEVDEKDVIVASSPGNVKNELIKLIMTYV